MKTIIAVSGTLNRKNNVVKVKNILKKEEVKAVAVQGDGFTALYFTSRRYILRKVKAAIEELNWKKGLTVQTLEA